MACRSTHLHLILSKNLSILLLLALPGLTLFSQTIVKGKLVDRKNQELFSGAVVLQKGTENGTKADANGDFQLTLIDSLEQTLQISHTHYYSFEVKVDGKNELIVDLQSRRIPRCGIYLPRFSASVGAVKSVWLNQQQSGGFFYASQLFQNEVAGLQVSRPGDNPNQDFSFRLRGISSFQLNSSPLIVVDGLPQNSMSIIDPNDVSSIRVLKDAAAAAQYGVLGQKGVIEIYTLSASIYENRPLLTYHTSLSAHFLGRKVPVAGPEQFLRAGGVGYGHQTDWMNEITETALSHGHHLKFNKNHEFISYSAALGYRSNRGVLKRSGFEQMNGRAAFQARPHHDLSISGQLAFTKRDMNYSSQEAIGEAIRMNPTAPIKSTDPAFEEYGNYFFVPEGGDNPVAMINNRTSLERIIDRSGNLVAKYRFSKGHLLTTTFNLQQRDNVKAYKINFESRTFPRRSKVNIDRSLVNFETRHRYFNYLGSVRIFQSTGIGFYRARQSIVHQRSQQIFDDTPLEFSNINSSLSNYADNVESDPFLESGHRVYSLFSNTHLKDSLWDLNIHLKYNGLTYFTEDAFNDDINYALFYGATLGIDLINLQIPFLQNFCEAKLRFGYGKTGSLYEMNHHFPYDFRRFGDQEMNTIWRPINMEDDEVIKSRWEEKKEINLGLDFVYEYDRFYGSIEFYQSQLTDLLVNQLWWVVPFGEVSNSGVEIDLTVLPIKKNNFRWETNFLFATNKSVLGRFSTIASSSGPVSFWWLENGRAAGQLIAYDVEEELVSGSYARVDVNGDGIILPEDDTRIIGSAFPKLNLGWQNRFSFGKWSLLFKFRSQLGHLIANGYRAEYEHNNTFSDNFVVTKYFREDLTNGIFFPAEPIFEKGDFLKLDYLNIGYDISSDQMDFHIYLSGQNLLTWTGYTGLDPETRYQSSGHSSLLPGYEYTNGHFRSKTVTLGVQVALK
ncbi:MAG: carboxypeptidase-like regulatory domain-containing protein [Bacteroidota bacterium]